MTKSKDPALPGQKLALLFPLLEKGLYERGRELRICMLAALAGESVFLFGLPGTAKSMLARRIQLAFDKARCFDYLMGRFSTPEELFGPLSIKALKEEDRLARHTAGYLPEADIVFLDEIWKASPPIQNMLLTALNERIYRNGDREMKLPLKLLMAASNEGPGDDASQAFWDRFLLRIHVSPLMHPDHVRMLLADRDDPGALSIPAEHRIAQDEWEFWVDQRNQVELDPASLEILVHMRLEYASRHVQGEGPYISDRRWKKAAGLVRAAALCHDRMASFPGDTRVILDALVDGPGDIDQALVTWKAALTAVSRSAAKKELVDAVPELERAQGSLGMKERIASREVPQLRDGEYLVVDFTKDQAGAAGAGGGAPAHDETRLWQDDFEALTDGGPPGAVELFVFRDGEFIESRDARCERSGWQVHFPESGHTGRVRTIMSTQRVLETEGPDESTKAELQARAQHLLAELATHREDLTRELARYRSMCEGHLFLAPDDMQSILQIPAGGLETLARLEAVLRGF